MEIAALEGSDADTEAASSWDNYEIDVVDLAIDGAGRIYGFGGDLGRRRPGKLVGLSNAYR